LIFVFLALAILMFASALIELDQSKKELLDLMKKQAHTLLETVLVASNNALLTYDHLERFLEERLVNNAGFIRYLYEKGAITDAFLHKFANENRIYRINIFDRQGNKIYSSHLPEHDTTIPKHSPSEILGPIFNGTQDTLIIGLKAANYESGYRYAVALATKDRSAIVLNLNAENLLNFRKQIGFGTLLKQISNNPGIVYVALQDTSGIIAASGNVRELDRIVDSPFLQQSFQDSVFATRISRFESFDVLETVHPLYFEGMAVGLFRLGVSLEPLNFIRTRIYRRIVIISLVLFVIGIIMFTLIMVRQNLNLLQKQYQVVETYSGNIIRNVSDAIIVFDEQLRVKIFNKAAEILFGQPEQEIVGKNLSRIFAETECQKLLDSQASLEQVECDIKNQKKYLLVSKNIFSDENNVTNTILVIRDLTEQRKMEAQIQRKERLSAMGELASGVAHEIRNPLNTIGIIVQQLDKDFEPQQNREEFHQLARLVNQEVRRINDTVQDFLRFARPEPVKAEPFVLSELTNYITQQYKRLLAEHRIKLIIKLNWDGEVYWDRRQMQQVFMNLIQNSIDAMQEKENGKIEILVNPTHNQELEIMVKDNGPGIPEHIQSRIFNLYFTTKAKGTGIGLSIVQRIIIEHGGMITVSSDPRTGTCFTIRMPIKINNEEADGSIIHTDH